MTRSKTAAEPKATLHIEVEFDDYPEQSEIVEILDKIRETGAVRVALFKTMGPIEKDMANSY